MKLRLLQVLLMSGLIGGILAELSYSQQAPKRLGRFNAKPGEVITRPDLSMRWPDKLQVGAEAPEFTLPLLRSTDRSDGSYKSEKTNTVSLAELRSKRPVVLVFGSMTCPPFRSQLDGIDEVYDEFKDRAEFLFVYVREAHPDSVLLVNDDKGSESLQPIPQASDNTERSQAATYCQRTLQLKLPIAVDKIDNQVGEAYAGWPNRMVVVDTQGKIIYASPAAPNGTNSQKLREWLRVHFADTK